MCLQFLTFWKLKRNNPRAIDQLEEYLNWTWEKSEKRIIKGGEYNESNIIGNTNKW